MALSVHETLKAMRELLSDEKRWTQGANARNQRGKAVSATGPTAVCWCVLGAMLKTDRKSCEGPLRNVIDRHFGILPHEFNDTHTHAEVLAKLDDAIKATENA